MEHKQRRCITTPSLHTESGACCCHIRAEPVTLRLQVVRDDWQLCAERAKTEATLVLHRLPEEPSNRWFQIASQVV